jgi:hypothetical protein
MKVDRINPVVYGVRKEYEGNSIISFMEDVYVDLSEHFKHDVPEYYVTLVDESKREYYFRMIDRIEIGDTRISYHLIEEVEL